VAYLYRYPVEINQFGRYSAGSAHELIRPITFCRLIALFVHSFIADTTSPRATISQGGTFPGIMQFPCVVLVVDDVVVVVGVVDELVDVLVDVVVDDVLLVVDDVVVDVVDGTVDVVVDVVVSRASIFPLYSPTPPLTPA
jgi:hypothetical protein